MGDLKQKEEDKTAGKEKNIGGGSKPTPKAEHDKTDDELPKEVQHDKTDLDKEGNMRDDEDLDLMDKPKEDTDNDSQQKEGSKIGGKETNAGDSSEATKATSNKASEGLKDEDKDLE